MKVYMQEISNVRKSPKISFPGKKKVKIDCAIKIFFIELWREISAWESYGSKSDAYIVFVRSGE